MAKARTNYPSHGRHDAGSHLQYAATVEFSRKLRRLMAKAQMSQSDLARECWGEEETSDGYMAARGRDKINRYVTGKTMPDPESLRAMARALGVPEAELAPSVVGTALEREHPEIRVTMIAGHREHVHITIDSVVPLEAAVEHMALFKKYRDTRGATARERATEQQPTPELVKAMQQALDPEGRPAERMRHNTRRGRRAEAAEAETEEEAELSPKQLEMLTALVEKRMERHMAKLREERESIETPAASERLRVRRNERGKTRVESVSADY